MPLATLRNTTSSVSACVHHLPLCSPTQNKWRAIIDHVVAAEDALSSHLLLMEGQRCDCALRTPPSPCSGRRSSGTCCFLRRAEPEHLGPTTVIQLPPWKPWQHPWRSRAHTAGHLSVLQQHPSHCCSESCTVLTGNDCSNCLFGCTVVLMHYSAVVCSPRTR